MAREFKNEAQLQGYCLQQARTWGAIALPFTSPGHTGLPDTIFMIPGRLAKNDHERVVFVEFKHPNGQGVLSELQKDWSEKLFDCGIPAFVCDNFPLFRAILGTYIEGTTEFRGP